MFMISGFSLTAVTCWRIYKGTAALYKSPWRMSQEYMEVALDIFVIVMETLR
jgi:hypothetical protein